MSIAGGVWKALLRGAEIKCTAIQLFTKNASQWRSPPISDEAVERFQEAQSQTGIFPVVAHDAYLINLASPDKELYSKSIQAFRDEISRCERLAIPYLVAHPGSHLGAGEEEGIRRIVEALDFIREQEGASRVKLLLENTAGQGKNIGYRFEHLRDIIGGVRDGSWLGVCFDTCHAFAAGYDLRTKADYEDTWKVFSRTIGLKRLHAIHMNDSKKGLGCRVDRHEHIGKGHLGLESFRLIMNDPRFEKIPKLLETPKEEGELTDMDRRNLAVLRKCVLSIKE